MLLQETKAKKTTGKKGAEKKSLMEVVAFEDHMVLSGTRFNFRIAKVQQEALNKARGHLPHPSKQLELVNQRRKKESRGCHACNQP